jgi:hypothetical protein
MLNLDPATHRRLIASLRLLNSDNEGERQAAFQAVSRLLPQGATLADLVGDIPPPPKRKVTVPDFSIVRTAHLGGGA